MGKMEPEVEIIRKVLEFTHAAHPKELKKAAREFQLSEEADLPRDKYQYSRALIFPGHNMWQET